MGFFQRNKRVVFACILLVVAVIVIASILTKIDNQSGPSVRPGEYVNNDLNEETPLISGFSTPNDSTSNTNNEVIDHGIAAPAPLIDVVQTLQTSNLNKFTLSAAHVNYGTLPWPLGGGYVWVAKRDVEPFNINVYKDHVLVYSFTHLTARVHYIEKIDATRVLVAYGPENSHPTVVKMYVKTLVATVETWVEQERTWAARVENIIGERGIGGPSRVKGSFGEIIKVLNGHIYITGSEYSPETKGGVVYVFDMNMELRKVLVDSKMVSLLALGYTYEPTGDITYRLSMDMSPNNTMLAVGFPNGDIKSTTVTLPGSQGRMPNGFFMLFEKWISMTDPLDDYNYVTRTTITDKIGTSTTPVTGFGNVVKFWSDDYLMVTSATNDVVYVYFIAYQAAPKLMTRITFPERITTFFTNHLIRTNTYVRYVDRQLPLDNNATNLFGTLVTRSSIPDGAFWTFDGDRTLTRSSMSYTVV